ncbi:hypothetical protein RUM43_011512 [Polyplax serrata]|uniref:Cadherin domain-containing protein n=1 Tax=Polyplax serrata TaxID=468196 RepID=A0AAN8NTV7_POLSC
MTQQKRKTQIFAPTNPFNPLFDREKRSVYEFQVLATDGGRYDARSTKVPVQIVITDVNDNKPIFSSYPFSAQVPVHTQAGASVIKVTASDADEGTNSEIVYSFVNEPANNKFKINPNTGLVTASSSLSGDAGRLFHLEILARDRGNPPQSGRGLLEIRVGGGVETSALRFQNSSYEVTISENLANNKEIVQVSAVRTDGRRQKIKYSLLTGKHENVFSIDPKTGWVKVENQSKLDYESYKEMSFSVVAEADGPLYGYCEMKIKLEDQNDNAPRFTQEYYTASVWEGNNKGTYVMQVSANDLDEGSNAHVNYHIVDGNHDNAFVIEPSFSGLIKTNIVLDREIRDTYKLTIIATDEGNPQLTGTTIIRINIVDANDNQPTFPPHSAITVSEDTDVGTVLAAVTANDVDTNPALTYFFSDETEEFSIDRFSGKIVLGKKLDFESQKEYRLAITASDTAHTAQTSLIIRVTDVNDNPPAFWQTAYQVSLPDGNDAVTPLLTVNASDLDSGNNAKIKFSLLKPLEGFTVDSNKGTIYANKSALLPSLMTEGIKDIDLAVVATDMGKPSLSSLTSIRVRVNNDKDFVPYFTQEDYQIRISENIKPGTSILKVSSTDNGKNMADFTIIGGNDDGIFQILSPDGDLILLKKPDREKKNSYSLHVSAGNLMYRSNNATIHVSIDDANDNPPMFQGVDENGIHEVYLSESLPVGTTVITLYANDTDLPGGSNTELSYEIISGNDENLFSIDTKEGTIRVKNPLDYDRGQTVHNLLVRVSDHGKPPDHPLSNLATIRIKLKDENDNAPKFPVLEYLEFVAENEPTGTSVFTARALDADKGLYGKLNYSILPDSPSGFSDPEGSWKFFRVDPNTGVVSTNSVFDYEARNRYVFTLQAMDIGGKATKVRVHIEIESKDEYHPQFTDRTYRFMVPPPGREGVLVVGSVVGTVEATDRDKGPDGVVVYQLTTQQTYFKINRTTGSIMIKKKLDDNVKVSGRDISFIVTASSGKQGSLTNTTVVEIIIDPLADHGINLASATDSEGATMAAGGGLADWALGLLISLILILLLFGGVFLFLHMKNRRHKNVNKSVLTSGVVNPGDGFVDPSAFDTVPIRGSNGIQGTGPFAPPKYDEIPPYGNAHRTSSSGNATTSELSGSEQSGSSGRGSAEDGEDVEDEEIRMINEGPLQREGVLHRQTMDEDNISDVSVHNTQEYLARLGIVDNSGMSAVGVGSSASRRSSDALSGGNKDILQQGVPIDSLHMFDEDGTAEADISNLIYAKLNDVSERGSAEDSSAVDHVILSGFDVPGVNGVGTQQPSMTGSLSSIVHSEEELTGSYNWDYLLDWGPQYQPLAHVFSEIARLKDDTTSVQSTNSGSASSKGGKAGIPTPKTLPPPLLTSVAPRSIAAPVIAPRGPGHTSHHTSGPHHSVAQQHQLLLLPRSPISHDATGASFSTSAAMSPSFSPSLSPLANRSPSISPLFTPGMTTSHHVVSIPRPSQRTAVNETELRI